MQANIIRQDCGDFDDANLISIRLGSGSSAPSRTVFEFRPLWVANDQPEPVLTWIGADELRISVGKVWSIDRQLTQADNILISYRIGKIEVRR